MKATIMAESTSNPYNIREKQEKNAAYRSLIRAELADELYDKILNIIIIGKRYRDKDFSAKELAVELGTNTRYISAVINSRFNTNFSCLVNEYRIKEAQHRLTDKRFLYITYFVEYILLHSLLLGYCVFATVVVGRFANNAVE